MGISSPHKALSRSPGPILAAQPDVLDNAVSRISCVLIINSSAMNEIQACHVMKPDPLVQVRIGIGYFIDRMILSL